jgi:hypothetical protein
MLNEQTLFEELSQKAREEGVADAAAWSELVETLLEEHLKLQELHDDNPLEAMEDALRGRFEEYKQTLSA